MNLLHFPIKIYHLHYYNEAKFLDTFCIYNIIKYHLIFYISAWEDFCLNLSRPRQLTKGKTLTYLFAVAKCKVFFSSI